jgi:hypothetical protein
VKTGEGLPWAPKEIESVDKLAEADLFGAVVPRSKPLVIRGLVSRWPAVELAGRSAGGFCDHLKQLDTGDEVEVMEAPADVRGRLFYSDDLHDFNFTRRSRTVSEALDRILAQVGAAEPEAIYMGSVPIRRHLPEFQAENAAPFALPIVAPRIWIGGPARVQTHFDPVHNLACVVAGRRRFVVFPPEQVANLYLGPFELTPAGAAISLASLEEPDFERFPRLKAAMETAQAAVLEPGDVLFLPNYWFHHVTATEPFNVLVNYWWGRETFGLDNPRNGFLAALMSLKGLTGDEKLFWKTMVDHFVFQTDGDPVAHLPPDLQSAFGEMTPLARDRIRKFTLSLLNEGS